MSATRLHNYLFAFTVFLFVMQLAVLSAQAQTAVTTCGTVITQPGRYILANDLVGCPRNGIVIETAGVDLDLNSHQITGAPNNQYVGLWLRELLAAGIVRVYGPATISGFLMGVNIAWKDGLAFVVDVASERCPSGFNVSNSRVVLRGDIATNGIDGFALFDTSDSELFDNTARETVSGFVIRGNNNLVTHNIAVSNSVGIETAAGSKNNHIQFNEAVNNGVLDLAERNATCVNTWENNTFGKANRSCIH